MARQKFQILPHPADVRVWAIGKNLPELFANLGEGVMAVLKKDYQKVKPAVERRIQVVDAPDNESLLVDFLSELLRLADTYNEIYSQIEITKLAPSSLTAKVRGEKIKKFDEDIKAVTYHGLKIEKEDNLWTATVLFDI